MKKRLRYFQDPGIEAACLLVRKNDVAEQLDVDQNGVIAVPTDVKPTGFYLVVVCPKEMRIVIVQKDIATERGSYHSHFLAQMGNNVWTTTATINVERNGTRVWTPWHRERTNRLDCWILDLDGHVKLFQVGVITHDDGVTFRLLGESRWEGQLFWHPDPKRGVVGKPDDPKWGKFDIRRTILNHPDFKKLHESAKLQDWKGKEEELDPPLDPVPEPGMGRMQWYVPFAGQTGQGPVTLHDGTDAWIHGSELMIEPDPDGIKRLNRNELIRYAGTQKKWGSKFGPPKLLCVERV